MKLELMFTFGRISRRRRHVSMAVMGGRGPGEGGLLTLQVVDAPRAPNPTPPPRNTAIDRTTTLHIDRGSNARVLTRFIPPN